MEIFECDPAKKCGRRRVQKGTLCNSGQCELEDAIIHEHGTFYNDLLIVVELCKK